MISGKTGCGLSYAVRRSSSSVAFCSLSVRCGTRDEEGFHSGIAHFTEHTIFKGTAHKSASVINSYLDHRIAMAFSIAGLAATGTTTIQDSRCVDVSYPEFYESLGALNQ